MARPAPACYALACGAAVGVALACGALLGLAALSRFAPAGAPRGRARGIGPPSPENAPRSQPGRDAQESQQAGGAEGGGAGSLPPRPPSPASLPGPPSPAPPASPKLRGAGAADTQSPMDAGTVPASGPAASLSRAAHIDCEACGRGALRWSEIAICARCRKEACELCTAWVDRAGLRFCGEECAAGYAPTPERGGVSLWDTQGTSGPRGPSDEEDEGQLPWPWEGERGP